MSAAKNVITPSNSINQIYVKFITCLPTKLNCLIWGEYRVVEIVWIKWNGWAITLVRQNTYWIFRWAVKQIWRQNLQHYPITLVKLDILYESLQLSEVMKARTIFAAKSMFEMDEMDRQHVKRKTVAQCHGMFWYLLIHWIEILHRLMLKQAWLEP